jgi:Ca2+-binding EF-hand superfamily protein
MKTDFDIEELVKQANITFDKYDTNKSDTIEAAELKILLSELAEEIGMPVPDDEEVSVIMDDHDRNYDKVISREEFIDLYKLLCKMREMGKKDK